MHFDSKTNAEQSHNSMLQQIDGKYNQRLKEHSERANAERLELTARIKNLEREKSHLTERLELSSRDSMSDAANLSKRYEKEKELNERLNEELESIKSERDRKVTEFQSKLDKERENFNTRKREIENRAARAESKQTQLMLGHESEKATWDIKISEMKHQIDELKSKNDRLQANLEQKEQMIGSLKSEAKNARRNYMTAAKNTDNSLAAGVGAGLLNKLNLPGAKVGGYQPKMFGAQKANGVDTDGAESARSFATRFGSSNQVSASMELSGKFGQAL